MTKADKYNDLRTQMLNILNTENGSKEETEAFAAWELSSNETFYNSLIEGFIYESDLIFDTLEFYIRINDEEKIQKLVSILNTYYAGYLKGKFDEFIANEEYEMCGKLSKIM
jgi:hypothetical protein